jgi:hypothetical protein
VGDRHPSAINKGDLMTKTIVTTNPNELRDAPIREARMSATRPLTRRRSRRIDNLPADRNVVSVRHAGVRDGVPFARRPDGRTSPTQPSGGLVTSGVESVQSYLQVHG